MHAIHRLLITSQQGGNLALVLTVAAAYLSTFVVPARPFSPTEVFMLVVAGVVFVIVGMVGMEWCERTRSPMTAALYFAIQIGLGTAILYLSRFAGTMWLIPLPLVAQSVILLPTRWVAAVCGVILMVVALNVALIADWAAAAQTAISYLAAIAFVVVFTQITVREHNARVEVERLAAELREANRKLRAHAAQVEELAITKERNRLAREIHDTLGHYLTVVNVQLEAARAVMDSDHTRALDAINKAQRLTQEGLADVRRSVAALRSTASEQRPLTEAISALVDESRTAGIQTELHVSGSARPLKPQAELTLYRAAQEGLTNVRKHAEASHAELTLDYSNRVAVRLVVTDDGHGVNGGSINEGFGLLGLRERAQLLGGQVCIQSEPEQGFTLEVELPT